MTYVVLRTRARLDRQTIANFERNADAEPRVFLGNRTSAAIQKFKNIEHNNKQPIYEILNELYEDPSKASRIY